MTSSRLQQLKSALTETLGARVVGLDEALGEVTLAVKPDDYAAVATMLRDRPELRFEELIDLCGVDYMAYGDGAWTGARFAVVVHLLSITHNWRLRVRSFAADDELPIIDSVTGIWPVANWFEREAFDLFGIIFTGHTDLRRILTDYGFVGHPFRKDFPITGNVEMRYDPDQRRVVYQPVTIEPREIVPRVVREEKFGDLGAKNA
jgi:NADH-quinone oxidoreductase subunit C